MIVPVKCSRTQNKLGHHGCTAFLHCNTTYTFTVLKLSATKTKPSLVKAQTALKKTKKSKKFEKRFSVWRMEFLHPQCGTIILSIV